MCLEISMMRDKRKTPLIGGWQRILNQHCNLYYALPQVVPAGDIGYAALDAFERSDNVTDIQSLFTESRSSFTQAACSSQGEEPISAQLSQCSPPNTFSTIFFQALKRKRQCAAVTGEELCSD